MDWHLTDFLNVDKHEWFVNGFPKNDVWSSFALFWCIDLLVLSGDDLKLNC